MTRGAAAFLPRLMLVTDRRRTRGRDLVELVERSVRGGVGWVQLREKDLPDDELRELVRRIRERVPSDTWISVNGSLRVSATAGVGLHLSARTSLPGGSLRPKHAFGRSVHDDAELRSALSEGVDYVLAGTIFPTESKPGRPAGGVTLVERICRQAHPTPVYAIGGITVSRVPPVVHAGAYGVAACGALLAANDPEVAARTLMLGLSVAVRCDKDRRAR